MSTRVSSRASTTSSARRYRTKARTSEVDDMLFGDTTARKMVSEKQKAPLSEEETMKFAAGTQLPKHSNVKTNRRKPETVRVITKDLIRDVVVPSEEPQGTSIILPSEKFMQISKKAFTSLESDKRDADKKIAYREELQKQMQERKKVMNQYDLKRKEHVQPNDLEQESRTIAEELIKRSKAKRLEENDEIKRLNELILEAKCHAIRDAQVAEKKQIEEQMKEEQDRLDAMMEIDRVQAIQQQEEIVRKRKEQRLHGATQIMKQIESNHMAKLLDQERKDQEARLLVENQKKMQMQDLAEIEKKLREQRVLQAEIDIINREHQKQRQLLKEQEKLADLRVIEYQKKKAQAEAQAEEEYKAQALAKELEIAKLRAAQEKASDLQAEQDAIRAKRHEEATEREYRRKVRDEAAKKKIIDEEMGRAREEQIQAKRHLMAVQAARERAEFDALNLEQQQEIAKIAAEEEKKHTDRRKYADEVRAQIREREAERIQARKAFFEETIQLDKEIEAKNKQLEEVKLQKLQKLKDSGVPEKYVMEVARHTNGGKIKLDEKSA